MPAAPWIVPALLVSLALLVSALFKVRAPETTQDAFVSLRLPHWLRTAGAPRLLPYVELVLAAALLFVPGPVYLAVAVLALALFVAYLVVVARALGFAEPVHCNCFGKLGLGEIDRRTVVRNALLVIAALLAVVDAARGGSMIERFTGFDAAQWGWVAGVLGAVLLTGFVVYGGGREPQPAPAALAPPDELLDYVQQPVPYGALLDTAGETVTLRSLAMNRPTLLVSVSIGCGSCERVMARLPQWAAEQPLIRVVAIPFLTDAADAPDLGERVEWMTDPNATVTQTLGMNYPSAVLFGPDGKLAGGPVQSTEVDQFLDDIAAEMAEAMQARDQETIYG